MKKILIIAEKPSVAMEIAKSTGAYHQADGYAESGRYLISWCFGHLAEYAPPETYSEQYKKWAMDDLPIVPVNWLLSVSDGKEKQFAILKELLLREDIEYAVNACDAGREGELIFWNVYELAGASVLVKRLWISSLEQDAIREGLRTMKDAGYYQGLRDAAICRARADWLVGLNATRGFSVKYRNRLLVGRVQSPTLAMIVERSRAIEGFQKQAYYRVMIKGSGIAAVSEAITEEAEADALVNLCSGAPAIITKVKKKGKRENPPKLYDLTALQRDANRYFGYTAKQTLDILQELYEAKLVTYPRTDSRYITSDMEASVSELLEALPRVASFGYKATEKNAARLVCDSKVSDHHAILPTKASTLFDVFSLPEKKRNVFLLVAVRLFCAAGGVRHTEETCVELTCSEHVFTAKGTAVTEEGFMAVENAFLAGYVKQEKKDEPKDISVVTILNEVFGGMEIEHPLVEKTKHYTSPPKPFTEDTLLHAMETSGKEEMDTDVERKGIGTPATRAATIEKIVNAGYVARKGKQLVPTAEGLILTDLLPERMKSAELTAEWENRLLAVERKKEDAGSFMADIISETDRMIKELKDREDPPDERNEALGACPHCGEDVIKGRYGAYCKGKCGMRFSIYGKPADNEALAALLSGGEIRIEEKSKKTGKPYTVVLFPDGIEEYSYDKEGETRTGWRFRFRKAFASGKGKKV